MRQLKIQKSITNRSSEALDKYLVEIGRAPLISIDEEIELAQKIKKGGPEGERAKNKLVTANLRFVVSVAKQYQHFHLTGGKRGKVFPAILADRETGVFPAKNAGQLLAQLLFLLFEIKQTYALRGKLEAPGTFVDKHHGALAAGGKEGIVVEERERRDEAEPVHIRSIVDECRKVPEPADDSLPPGNLPDKRLQPQGFGRIGSNECYFHHFFFPFLAHFFNQAARASAQRSPSTPAETMPPA